MRFIFALMTCVALSGNSAVVADPFDGDAVGFIQFGIRSLEVNQTGKAPIIVVRANGSVYDTVETQQAQIHFNTMGECKFNRPIDAFVTAIGNQPPLKDLTHESDLDVFKPYLVTHVPWGVESANQIAKKNTPIVGPLPDQVRTAAMSQCNTAAQNFASENNVSVRQAMSQTRTFPLAQTNWMRSNFQLMSMMRCDRIAHKEWTDDAVYPVNFGVPTFQVQCIGKPYRQGVGSSMGPTTLALPFSVTAMSLEVSPQLYADQCPVEVVLTGRITVNGPGEVMYRWRSGNTVSIPEKITFASAGTRMITRKVVYGQDTERTHTLLTDGPGILQSNSVTTEINCVTPPT